MKILIVGILQREYFLQQKRWDKSFKANGRRIGVVGTGASAVQAVPLLALHSGLLQWGEGGSEGMSETCSNCEIFNTGRSMELISANLTLFLTVLSCVEDKRCPHSGVGRDFFLRRRVTLTKTAVTRKRKVEKSIRRCQIDCLAKGYKWAIDNIRGPIAKNGFSGKNPAPWPENGPPSNHMALFWGPGVNFFRIYRQVGYPERRNDMP